MQATMLGLGLLLLMPAVGVHVDQANALASEVAGCIVGLLLLSVSSTLSLTAQQETLVNVERMVDTVVAEAQDPDRLIVTTEPAVGRLDITQLDDDHPGHAIDQSGAWEGWDLSGPTPLPRYQLPLEMWEATR